MISPEFLLTSLIVVLIPGTGVIYTVSTALMYGWRSGIAAAIGCTFGIVPHILASILGISAIFHMSAFVFQTLKLVGALYLLYLAFTMWRESGELNLRATNRSPNPTQIILRGFLLNILNPKLSIFFLAYLPLFISADTAAPLFEMGLLSLIFMVMTLVVFILYGISAHGFRRYVVGSSAAALWIQRTFAIALGACGMKLALADDS